MKTTAAATGSAGVTRFGNHHGSTFSATTSTYQSMAGGGPNVSQGSGGANATTKGVIYQLDQQNLNYIN